MRTLEERLGYTFRDRKRLEGALYHSSYANEHRSLGIHSNERLEFLGDAVLGLVTADYLFRKHPDLPEGDLTLSEAGQGRGGRRRPAAGVHTGGRHGVRFCRRVSGRRVGGGPCAHSPGPAG